MRRAAATAASLAALTGAAVTLAPAAHANETVRFSGGYVKFIDYGDKVYVKDTKADGKSIRFYYWTDYGRNGGPYNMTRGAGNSRTYNFNFAENHKIVIAACLQDYPGAAGESGVQFTTRI
jgi:hypothetical protein